MGFAKSKRLTPCAKLTPIDVGICAGAENRRFYKHPYSLSWVLPLCICTFFRILLHLKVTANIFGKSLLKDSDKTGLVMGLPPYHKHAGEASSNGLLSTFKRAIWVVIVAYMILWIFSYTPSGDFSDSILYKVGTFIEPVTMIFGLKW